MIRKRITIISVLIVTNIITGFIALVFYSVMSMSKDLIEEKNHHLSINIEQLRDYIIYRNKDLTIQQFKEKHGIKRELESYELKTNTINHNLLYFQFKKGVLSDVE